MGHWWEIESLYKQYGLFCSSLLRLRPDLPRATTYAQRFGSIDFAFQQLHNEHRHRARQLVHEQIRQHVPEVLSFADFLVLDQKLALSVQPSVPIPHGYSAYWPFRPDYPVVCDAELRPDTAYEILIYGSMRVDDFEVPELRANAQELIDMIDAAFNACCGIEVAESCLKSEADVSLDDRRKLKRWDFDDLTVRGRATSELPSDD